MTLTGLHWRRIRLFTVLGIMVSLSLGLILHALKTNINAYVTPTGLLQSEQIEAPKRLGGLVESMSVVYDQYHKVHFAVSDGNQQVNVVFDGVLPALFEEGKGVVAQGHYDSAHEVFVAEQVLAKHDENYQPPLPA